MTEPTPRPLDFWLPVPASARWLAGVLLALCLGLLGVASWLKPDESALRMGTHMQLGFTPCGFVFYAGLPCPSCGMTTAFACTVRGRFLEAFLAQPAGFVLCLATVLTAAICLVILVSGRRPRPPLFFWLHPARYVWLIAGLFVFGWGFKLAHGYLAGILPLHR